MVNEDDNLSIPDEDSTKGADVLQEWVERVIAVRVLVVAIGIIS